MKTRWDLMMLGKCQWYQRNYNYIMACLFPPCHHLLRCVIFMKKGHPNLHGLCILEDHCTWHDVCVPLQSLTLSTDLNKWIVCFHTSQNQEVTKFFRIQGRVNLGGFNVIIINSVALCEFWNMLTNLHTQFISQQCQVGQPL